MVLPQFPPEEASQTEKSLKENEAGESVKFAVMDWLPDALNEQGFVPVPPQVPPVQLENSYPESGKAVAVTAVPADTDEPQFGHETEPPVPADAEMLKVAVTGCGVMETETEAEARMPLQSFAHTSNR